MLAIRLSRHGRKNLAFFRIVLSEHTKPVKTGYKEVLGWYNPLNHQMEINVDQVKGWISKGARPSERVAKLLYTQTKDALFKKFFEERTRTAKPTKESENK